MDNSAGHQPDRSPSPEGHISTPQELEAMKEKMTELMMQRPESHPDYMQTIMHLYRQPDPDSKPKHLFFYGSLMDPDVIRVIADTSTEPELHKASISGFKLKMWGFYPTLIRGGPTDVVHGIYWQAENDRQLGLLQRYETHRYYLTTCPIRVEKDGRIIEEGLTFMWAGDADSSELKDGEFLLERYQLYFKPDAFKRNLNA